MQRFRKNILRLSLKLGNHSLLWFLFSFGNNLNWTINHLNRLYTLKGSAIKNLVNLMQIIKGEVLYKLNHGNLWHHNDELRQHFSSFSRSIGSRTITFYQCYTLLHRNIFTHVVYLDQLLAACQVCISTGSWVAL